MASTGSMLQYHQYSNHTHVMDVWYSYLHLVDSYGKLVGTYILSSKCPKIKLGKL